MKLKVSLSLGFICGDDVRDLIDMAHIDSNLFSEHSDNDEYCFTGEGKEVEMSVATFFLLTKRFPVEIYQNKITIWVN